MSDARSLAETLEAQARRVEEAGVRHRTRTVQALVQSSPPAEGNDPLAAELSILAAAAAEAAKVSFALAGQLDHPKFRHAELGLAAKLAGTTVELVGALDRHTGKGALQTLRIERVQVQAGAQAVVGLLGRGVADQEVGADNGYERRPLAQVADAQLATVRRALPADGTAVPRTLDG